MLQPGVKQLTEGVFAVGVVVAFVKLGEESSSFRPGLDLGCDMDRPREAPTCARCRISSGCDSDAPPIAPPLYVSRAPRAASPDYCRTGLLLLQVVRPHAGCVPAPMA